MVNVARSAADDSPDARPRNIQERPAGVRGLSRVPLRRVIVFAVAVVGLYLVWPQLVRLFAQAPQLESISWVWFALMIVLEAGSYASAWGLSRLTLGERSCSWSPRRSSPATP